SGIERLLEVMRRLRDPEHGCPWDIEQDFATIAPYTIEEAYEVADAIRREAWDELRGELGDLLLQTVYHAQMAAERGWFDFDGVAHAIADKMIRRHPHVFGESTVESAAAQTLAWEQQKAAERAAEAAAGRLDPSVLADVPVALPALTRALKLQKRAARVGFDWPGAAPVLDKLREEIAELEAEVRTGGSAAARREELGDLLFTAVNLARHLGIDPETALQDANHKFERRFRAMEASRQETGGALAGLGGEELEALWEAAKRGED
ncbi:MAG TPA: nucleoside triphosphate pyrophosphohydrolase, partial [Geminicoccaceae bacterium]|nr:nucleoside triphosphate pyrophosphohydrolase [Geminicoccaceae bacterium]